jgi:hypothetical protein
VQAAPQSGCPAASLQFEPHCDYLWSIS